MAKNISLLLLGLVLLVTAFTFSSAKQVVKNGDTITVNYTLMLADEKVYYSSIGREPLKATLGQGKLLPGFEEEVIGMHIGESKIFTLPAEKAYGQYRPDLVGTVDRNWLPENVQPEIGKQLQTELKDGTPTLAIITAFTDTTITLDANHPLTGQTLTFDIELMRIESNLTTPTGPNQTIFSWLIAVSVVAVASFLLLKTRNRQISIIAKKHVNARSRNF